MAWLAWHTASLTRIALSRRKDGRWVKMPKLETMLTAAKRDRRVMSPDEMLSVVKMLNAAYGGFVSDKPRKKRQ